MKKYNLLLLSMLIIAIVGCGYGTREKTTDTTSTTDSSLFPKTGKEINMTNQDWKEKLSDEQFRVLRQCGTEPAFTGKYYNHKEVGMYLCAGCGAELFSSDTKYDSGSGWPSFWNPATDEIVKRIPDNSFGMRRIEIKCAKCDGHLGHVFEDGPPPTGLRYCINSIALSFKSADSDSMEIKSDMNE